MMLTNNHLKPILGVDVHIILIPPLAIPTPLPHPFIGMVMDVADYIPFVGATVKVNGLPRGNAGTSGMLGTIKHIPMGGPFMMLPMIGHDSNNFFGSTRVSAEGSYLSAAGYMVMTCNDIGMPLSLTPGKKMKPVPSLYLPSSATLPIPSGPPVMVGGPYAPDLLTMVLGLAMSYGMGALMKGAGKGLKKGLKALNNKVLKKFKSTKGLSKKMCKLGFEPVDLITGRMLYEGEDFSIPGVIPLTWKRVWYSDSEYEGNLGYGFHHNYDLSLHIDQEENAIAMRLTDGRMTTFPLILTKGEETYNRNEKLTLSFIDKNTYNVKDHSNNLSYVFVKKEDNLFKLKYIKNRDGFALTCTYNAANQMDGFIDTVGRQIYFNLDTQGRITKIHATHQNKSRDLVSYAYNEEGDLTHITDALGQATIMEYQNHLMVKKTDRNGQAFYWEYDDNKTGSKCIKTWGDNNILAGTIEYGNHKNITTNSLGQQTVYYFDDNNLCTQVTDALGNHTFHEHTEYMEPFRDIDEEGNLTGYSYDERGNLTALTQADGSVTTFIYDDKDRLMLTKTPEGKSLTKVYKEDKLYANIAPDGAVTAFKYYDNGLVKSITDEASNVMNLDYDDDYNLIKLHTNNKKPSIWKFDAWGRCVKSVNPENHKQLYTYDVLDRVENIQQSDNNRIKLHYNAYDDVISTMDSKKRKITFDYTPLGSLKMREEQGRKLHFNYNTEEQLLTVVNEHNESYKFGRNPLGSIINETGFDGLRRDYLRDRAGKVLKVKRPDNRFTEYEYDSNGRIIRSEHHDGSWETFGYDKDGLLIEVVNQHSKVEFVRDESGRIIKEIQDGYEVESTYDSLGNRIHINSSLGADIAIKRNALGQVEQLTATVNQNEDEKNKTWSATYNYNSIGQEIERALPGGIISKTEYDFAGRPISQKVTKANRELRHRTYKWNVNDQLQTMVNQLTHGKVNYSYDDFGSLASAQYENGQFDYKLPDEVGNLYKSKGQRDRKYGKGGQLLEANGNTFKYDAEGNLITKITNKGNWEYSWYGNGMLKSIIKPDNKHIVFEYDALGRRTAKISGKTTLDKVFIEKNASITRFIWDINVPLHEWQYQLKDRPQLIIDEFGFLVKDKPEPIGIIQNQSKKSQQNSELTTWIFDADSFKPTAKIIGEQHYSILTDYLGTPVAMYNEEGDTVWEVEYDIYGKIRKQTIGAAGDCPFRYQGQYEDEEIGLYYNRYRYYSAEEGIYLSQDPIQFLGGIKLYGYVKDTNSLLDPLGLVPWPKGGFNDWFNNASPQDILDNKKSVESALRGDGGLHEMFPVSQAAKARELGFSAEELKSMTVETDQITFTGVTDRSGNLLPDGAHHNSRAGRHFHNKLIKDLEGAKTKAEATDIINRHHKKHMRLNCG